MARNQKGEYDYSKMDLVCECGHQLSVHAGENETCKRPCLNEDGNIDGADGINCSCKDFKLKRSARMGGV